MADTDKVNDAKQASKERDQLLLAYLRGELGDEETAGLRQRLADDPEYAERLEELLLGEELTQADSEEKAADFLPEEKQRAIIRWGKWKSRLSNAAYTVGISLLIGFVLLYVNYWIGQSLYEETFRVSKDLVNFTQPGIEVGGSSSSVGLFYGNIRMEMREKVGAASQHTGYFETSNIFSLISSRPSWNDGVRQKNLFFLFPLQAKLQEDTSFRSDPAWKTLEMLPEGTVSQLAISFNRFMSLEELYAFLSPYDLDLTWQAVDTGQEARDEDARDGVVLLSAGDVWGFSEYALDYGPGPIQVNGEVDRRTRAYVEEMKYLAGQERLSKAIGKSLIYSRSGVKIEERYQYLEKNGIRTYGIVVTGPTKELLKLKQEAVITAAFVGQIDWWNWDRPSASGEQSSR
ncbi:anti-sigma factor [Brevibacillus borstelensis]|uniref:anti-sigma factor n=1 Tax=Brevibacillus borstelensis TaxID=45462 RepID=UPI0030C6224C